MQDAAAVMRDLIDERITPEEEQAWITSWAQHPEDGEQLTALREEVSALLKDAQALAAKAARIRLLNSLRLRSLPASLLEDVSRVFSEDRLFLGAVWVEPTGSTH